MFRCSGFRAFSLFLGVALSLGCGAPDIGDFQKQEFIVQEKPVVHFALRGSRCDKKLICQVFLLTMSESMWISGADLKLSDGLLLDPESLESLDEDERDWYADRDFYYGTGYGWGAGYPRYPYYRRYWHYGPYTRYRSSTGACIPPWYLLDRPVGSKTPKSLQFTYTLPERQATSQGCELLVHIGIAREKGEKKKEEEGRKDAEAAAEAEKPLRVPFVFVLSEQPQPETADTPQQDLKKIVHEVKFTRQDRKPAE